MPRSFQLAPDIPCVRVSCNCRCPSTYRIAFHKFIMRASFKIEMWAHRSAQYWITSGNKTGNCLHSFCFQMEGGARPIAAHFPITHFADCYFLIQLLLCELFSSARSRPCVVLFVEIEAFRHYTNDKQIELLSQHSSREHEVIKRKRSRTLLYFPIPAAGMVTPATRGWRWNRN